MNYVHTTFCVSVILCHTSFSIPVCSVLPPLIAPVVVSAFFLSSSVFCSCILVSHLNQRWCSLSLPLSLHYWSEQFKQTLWRKHTRSGLNGLLSSQRWFLLDKTINWAKKGKNVKGSLCIQCSVTPSHHFVCVVVCVYVQPVVQLAGL